MSTSEGGEGGGNPGNEGAGRGGIFVPKEDLVTLLTGMGVTRNASIKALYHTGNYNADLAAAWIFENQDREDLDAPLAASDLGDSSDSEGELEDYLDESDFYKMVFVVNTELSMGVGKIAAQVAHAALGLYKHLVEEQQRYGEMLLQWEQFGETKIVLKGKNTGHIEELSAKSSALGVPNYIVQDAGKTQVAAGAVTVLGVMGKADVVNQVTGQLSLL